MSEGRRLEELEAENRRLKQIVADLFLDKEAMKSIIVKRVVNPVIKRAAVEEVQAEHGVSERRVCELVRQHRSTQRRESVKREISGLATRLLEHAHERPRFGYKRITTLLHRDGSRVNHNRIYRM